MTEEKLAQEFERQNITLASLQKRVAAFVIDEIIVGIFIFFAFSDMFENAVSNEDFLLVMSGLTYYIILMKVIYQTFFVWAYGATPGKMLLKIRVIYMYAINKPSLFTSALRATGRIISETFFYIGFIWAFFNPKKQAWQDLVAKTLVINA